MTWQKCPVCLGMGTVFAPWSPDGGKPCSVCKGQKIIHSGTGEPPKVDDTKPPSQPRNPFIQEKP